MKASDLKGRAVVTLTTAEKAGTIDDVLLDGQYKNVIGFRIKRGLFGQAEAVLRDRVSAIGRDAVTISAPDAVNQESRMPELSSAVPLGRVKETKVVSVGGNLVGMLDDVVLDDDARAVTGYTLSESLIERMRGGKPLIDVAEALQVGSAGIMTIPDATAKQFDAP